jgi:hypothetical protein
MMAMAFSSLLETAGPVDDESRSHGQAPACPALEQLYPSRKRAFVGFFMFGDYVACALNGDMAHG